MRKIKRHLSFTLRHRDQEDALVKKELSPVYLRKNNDDFAQTLLLFKREEDNNTNNREVCHGRNERATAERTLTSPKFSSFFRRSSSNSRLLSPPLTKPKIDGSKKSSSEALSGSSDYTNPAFKEESLKQRAMSLTTSNQQQAAPAPCPLKKSNSVKYTEGRRPTTLTRSLSVGAAARKNGYHPSRLFPFEPEDGFGRIESYTRLEKLGEGTYANVYKGRSNITGSLVALKETSLEHEEGVPCTAIREVSLLKGLKHANIVTLHDIVTSPKSITLIFEYVDRDLKQYMDACNSYICVHNIKLFTYQLLRGLEFCHKRKVLHRDLKPQNLLISDKGEVKLADFGLARAKSVPTKTYSHEVCTMWYRPPDVLLGSTKYSTPIDMWGVGCILSEMCTGKALFPGSTVEEELYLIFKTKGLPTESTWPGVHQIPDFLAGEWPHSEGEPIEKLGLRLDTNGVDLLDQLLKYPPRWRISAVNALQHDWFSSLPPAVHTTPPTESIFVHPDIFLRSDALLTTPFRHSHKDKKRRSKAGTVV